MAQDFNYTPEVHDAFHKILLGKIHTLYMRYDPGRNEVYVDKIMTPQTSTDIVNVVKDNYLNNACIIISSQHFQYASPQSIIIFWIPESAPFRERILITGRIPVIKEKFKCAYHRSYNVLSDFDDLKK